MENIPEQPKQNTEQLLKDKLDNAINELYNLRQEPATNRDDSIRYNTIVMLQKRKIKEICEEHPILGRMIQVQELGILS